MTPRPASEQLVAQACKCIDGPARVADVGTGTGAIAIAIAVRRPKAHVWATDIDERAAALARANVSRFGLVDRIFVRCGDLLGPVPGSLDVIVANLPYLRASMAAKHPELRGEPLAAVFAPSDGLGAYRRLVVAAATKLAPNGTLLLQLHGRVVVARHAQLPELHDALEDGVGETVARHAA